MKHHYADFKGRARRKEFWMFILISSGIIIAACILAFIFMSLSKVLGYITYSIISLGILALSIPIIAICIRRAHDTGRSGWYILIPVYNLILYITEGIKGENKYGSDPKKDERIN